MPFEFRIRFHLLPEDRLALAESRFDLPPEAHHLRLVAWKRDTTIAESPRVILVGGPYPTEDEARRDGQRARTALLLWALQRRLAIDLGDDRRRGGFTEAGRAHFSKHLGGPVREQLHGLDVYELIDGQVFVDISVSPGLQLGASTAIASLANWYLENRDLSDRQALASELYCAAHFDGPFRSRFITLMTAVEALLDYQPRPADVVKVVEELERTVDASTLERTAKQSLRSSLAWLHTESIGQAGQRTADQLLTGKEYGGKTPGKYFRDCYELRSTIIHTGRVPTVVDLLDTSNELHRFVGDLLHAAIRVPAI
jgi:hypothetical protein